jgi:hypothetical protein
MTKGPVAKVGYDLVEAFLTLISLIITTPFFIGLGSYRSYVLFARQRPDNTWIDSYSDYVATSKVTSAGLIALIIIIVFNLIVFYLTPVVILWIQTAYGMVMGALINPVKEIIGPG